MKAINAYDIDRLNEVLLKSEKTAIITHAKPDGDAAGSSTALYHFLKAYGTAELKIVLNDRFQPVLEFLADEGLADNICIYSDNEKAAADAIEKADTIVCLDFNAFHRTDTLEQVLADSKAEKVLIDVKGLYKISELEASGMKYWRL